MVNMDDIMNNFVGDWLYDRKKLAALTEERAIEDIWAMDQSPDYDGKDVNKAVRKARRQLGLREEEFLAKIVFKSNAHKVS